MSELYENLLKATNNIDDITNEKYATVTKVAGDYCSVQEEDTNLEHSQVPILNKITCETGDKVVLGFVNNSLYDPVIIGNLSRKISGSGGGDGLLVGSFQINEEGHLIATLPNGASNPYSINAEGHLIYSTTVD